MRSIDSEHLTQLDMLMARLPSSGGRGQGLCCKNCGEWLGAVANRAGVIFGHFSTDIEVTGDGRVAIGTKLERSAIVKGKPEIQCGNCGYITRWYK